MIQFRDRSVLCVSASGVWSALAVYVLFSVSFQNLPATVPAHGLISTIVALGIPILIGRRANSIASLARVLVRRVEAYSVGKWVSVCLLLGILLRVLIGVSFPSVLVSDPAVYWELAQRLAHGEPYVFHGKRAFWPPGFPLFLTPPVAVLGAKPWLPLVLNVALFVATALIVFRLTKKLAGDVAARLAVLVLAFWPNLILTSAAPHKELLVMFLVSAAMLSYLTARNALANGAIHWPAAIACGFCLGFAALTQPSTMLLGAVLVAWEIASVPSDLLKIAKRAAVIALVAVTTVLPWTVRNYVVYKTLIPINTAGGTAFYSANNPMASGGWIPKEMYRDKSFLSESEVQQNRMGYERGRQWIKENPVQFLKLVVYKHSRYLCCDSFGAFYLWKHPRATNADTVSGDAATVVSDAFWGFLWLAIVFGALRWKRHQLLRPDIAVFVSLPLWYALVVHGIYQSDGKHHIWVAGILAATIGAALSPAPESNRPEPPVSVEAGQST